MCVCALLVHMFDLAMLAACRDGALTWLAMSVAFLARRKSGVSLAMAFKPLPFTSCSRSRLYSFCRGIGF